jgi:cyclophilin family peptidyl-prolyl cis-trans isomerase
MAFLALGVASCSRDDRSKSAQEAIAAVEEFRGLIDEMLSLTQRGQDMEKRAIEGKEPPNPEELERIQARLKELNERGSKLFRSIPDDLERRLKADPKDAGLLDARSRHHETIAGISDALRDEKLQDRYHDALKDLEDARALLPKDASLRARRPVLLMRVNRYDESRADAAELLKEEPGHPVALAVDGLCLMALNQFAEAVPRLEEAAGKAGRLTPSLEQEVKATLETAKKKKLEWEEESKMRDAEAKADDLPRVKLVTSKGDVVVELFENEAPNTVANFIDLCDRNFYDGTTFHRVVPNFMVQGGDPLSKDKSPNNDGTGGPGYQFPDELGDGHRRHFRGTLSMANSGKDSNGSQFYITHRPTEALDGKHTVFGRVVEGMAVVDALRRGDELRKTEVLRKRPHAYRPIY